MFNNLNALPKRAERGEKRGRCVEEERKREGGRRREQRASSRRNSSKSSLSADKANIVEAGESGASGRM